MAKIGHCPNCGTEIYGGEPPTVVPKVWPDPGFYRPSRTSDPLPPNPVTTCTEILVSDSRIVKIEHIAKAESIVERFENSVDLLRNTIMDSV